MTDRQNLEGTASVPVAEESELAARILATRLDSAKHLSLSAPGDREHISGYAWACAYAQDMTAMGEKVRILERELAERLAVNVGLITENAALRRASATSPVPLDGAYPDSGPA